MSVARQVGYLCRKRIEVSTLIQLSRAVVSRNGTYHYSSTVMKAPLLKTDEIETDGGHTQTNKGPSLEETSQVSTQDNFIPPQLSIKDTSAIQPTITRPQTIHSDMVNNPAIANEHEKKVEQNVKVIGHSAHVKGKITGEAQRNVEQNVKVDKFSGHQIVKNQMPQVNVNVGHKMGHQLNPGTGVSNKNTGQNMREVSSPGQQVRQPGIVKTQIAGNTNKNAGENYMKGVQTGHQVGHSQMNNQQIGKVNRPAGQTMNRANSSTSQQMGHPTVIKNQTVGVINKNVIQNVKVVNSTIGQHAVHPGNVKNQLTGVHKSGVTQTGHHGNVQSPRTREANRNIGQNMGVASGSIGGQAGHPCVKNPLTGDTNINLGQNKMDSSSSGQQAAHSGMIKKQMTIDPNKNVGQNVKVVNTNSGQQTGRPAVVQNQMTIDSNKNVGQNVKMANSATRHSTGHSTVSQQVRHPGSGQNPMLSNANNLTGQNTKDVGSARGNSSAHSISVKTVPPRLVQENVIKRSEYTSTVYEKGGWLNQRLTWDNFQSATLEYLATAADMRQHSKPLLHTCSNHGSLPSHNNRNQRLEFQSEWLKTFTPRQFVIERQNSQWHDKLISTESTHKNRDTSSQKKESDNVPLVWLKKLQSEGLMPSAKSIQKQHASEGFNFEKLFEALKLNTKKPKLNLERFSNASVIENARIWFDFSNKNKTTKKKAGRVTSSQTMQTSGLTNSSDELALGNTTSGNAEGDTNNSNVSSDELHDITDVGKIQTKVHRQENLHQSAFIKQDIAKEDLAFFISGNSSEEELLQVEESNRRFQGIHQIAGSERKLEANDERVTLVRKLKQMDDHECFSCYLEVSCNAGMLSKALRDFRYLRNTRPFPVTLAMYNILMRGVANANAGLEVMRYLFQFMEEDKVRPNLESFGYALVLVSLEEKNALEYGPYILKDIKSEGLDISNIFRECEFTRFEANKIIKVIKLIEPDLELKPRFYIQPYTNVLTKELNTPAQLRPVNLSTLVNLENVFEQTKIQYERELMGTVTIPSVWEGGTQSDNKVLAKLLKNWRNTLEKAFRQQLLIEKKHAWVKRTFSIYPFMCIVPEKEFVDIMLEQAKAIVSFSANYSPPISLLQRVIGNAIYNRFKIHYNNQAQSVELLGACYEEYLNRTLNTEHRHMNYTQTWKEIARQYSPYTPTHLNPHHWNRSLQKEQGITFENIVGKGEIARIEQFLLFPQCFLPYKIGAFVLDLIIRNLAFEENWSTKRNCFHKVKRFRDFKMQAEIQVNPAVQKLFVSKMIIKTADTIPMLCPPLPTLSANFGGHLTNTSNIFRMDESALHLQWIKKVKPQPFYDALSTLANTAWVINKPVLDVVLHLFRNGGCPQVDIPAPPESIKPPPKEKRDKDSMTKYRKALSEQISLWHAELYKYSIANMFRDNVFWMPYFVDFRGRNYPLPIFSHLGNGVVRAMFKFADSRPLGKAGLRWLKIHLVNLTGLKKRSTLDERHDYVEEIMHEIEDSADFPLTGRKWWMKADEPVQFLAASMELMAALRSPDPEKFLSNFPVHQDGSCNGLQHYAALGLDVDGAKYVNLYPSERPADIYSMVVEHIRAQITAELAEMEEKDEIALTALKYLERKIIKPSVMTQVYGVTRYGTRAQIQDQLKDTNCPEEIRRQVASYLTDKTFHSLVPIFKAGKEIQNWLTKSAGVIGNSNRTVQWITPLDFPVIQCYFKEAQIGFAVSEKHKAELNLLWANVQKEKNGFAPNFIHSLDATHMLLTALYCNREGVRFAGVHDSFWTHPCDTDFMNKVTREQFVAMHKQPILEDLAEYFIKEYSCLNLRKRADMLQVFTNLPDKGDFDLDLVKKSAYFFS